MPQLINYGKEFPCISTKGIECSTNSGRSWNLRYLGSSFSEFRNLADGGKELLANTSKGLFIQQTAEEAGVKGANLPS